MSHHSFQKTTVVNKGDGGKIASVEGSTRRYLPLTGYRENAADTMRFGNDIEISQGDLETATTTTTAGTSQHRNGELSPGCTDSECFSGAAEDGRDQRYFNSKSAQWLDGFLQS